MFITFAEQELNNIWIKHIETASLNPKYILDRDQYWKQAVTEAKQVGRKLWNGQLYTLEDIRQPVNSEVVLYLGQCEYKDLVFANQFPPDEIEQRYGCECVQKPIAVICVAITTDSKFVVPTRAGGTIVEEGLWGLIGGTANQDETEVNQFSDLEQHFITELEEELHPLLPDTKIYFHEVVMLHNDYLFTYIVRLPYDSAKLSKHFIPGEFKSAQALTVDEIMASDHPCTPSFEFYKQRLRHVIERYSK